MDGQAGGRMDEWTGVGTLGGWGPTGADNGRTGGQADRGGRACGRADGDGRADNGFPKVKLLI